MVNVSGPSSAPKTNASIPQCSSGLLPLRRNFIQKPVSGHIRMDKSHRRFAVKAARYGDSGRHWSIVEEDMLVLRKRMHQLRMEEVNYIPPQQWMEWEKRWYPTYDSDVCSSLLWLQNTLLNTRPGVAMAIFGITLAECSHLCLPPAYSKPNSTPGNIYGVAQLFAWVGSQILYYSTVNLGVNIKFRHEDYSPILSVPWKSTQNIMPSMPYMFLRG